MATASGAKTLPGTSCPVFPADSWWQADVRSLKVHPRSSRWMASMEPGRDMHPDFGPAFDEQPIGYGIPITVVDGAHPKVPVEFDFDDSDHVTFPLGDDIVVEGGQLEDGDRHTVVVDRDSCRLWETWATERDGDRWRAGSGATWDLRSNALRTAGNTSADAAGLPILPGLLRYDEVASGHVGHAIRFTTRTTDRSYLWPARHQAGDVDDPAFPPMGARFRLKASYRIAPDLSRGARAVLTAMKTYGLVLADNGGPWFFQGAVDDRWESDLIDELRDIPAAALEAVDTSVLMVNRNSMAVDHTAPSTRITAKPRTSARRTVIVRFTSTERASTFRCTLDGHPARSCSSPLRLKNLAAGRHRLQVRAIDRAGNRDATPAIARWVVRKRA